ncbi:MAG: FAD-dependent oxidoreductase [Nitrospirae bacterium]|nr:FAD-dependent oxidoreductase [Nitrospirota bacterium]
MKEKEYSYVIVGAGLAGVSAAAGIREVDKNGPILLIGGEKHLPYDRPPLSKQLWFGKKRVADIFLHDRSFYDQNGIELSLETRVSSLDLRQKSITDKRGRNCQFGKLLLSTGGVPRPLPVPGGDLEGICYYRYLDDYLRMRDEARTGGPAVIVGGGFIGSEMAAALTSNGVRVTMVFPESYLCSRVFPDFLGRAMQKHYQERGVKILAEDRPASFSKRGDALVIRTEKGMELESRTVIAGIGIMPEIKLAAEASLKTANGVVVNEYLQTSHPDVYAAGDNAFFPYQVLGQPMRIEHWDNALNQGKAAGRNMAGAQEPFTYMPYFFSDLFEFGYEAVGEVDAQLETFADWRKENETGVVYYLRGGKVRGAMMCNVWDKVEAARELIRKGEGIEPEGLRGAIA